VTLRGKVCSCAIRKALNVKTLLRIERSQPRRFRYVSKISHVRFTRQVLLATPKRKRPRF